MRAPALLPNYTPLAIVLPICLLLSASSVRASSLLAPAVGAADTATAGTRIADPHTPAAALFANPAGLTGFDTFTHGGDIGIAYGRGRIEATLPVATETNPQWMVIPDFGLSVPYRQRWRFALGIYGSTGSRFDFGPDPAKGIPSLFSETSVVAVPLGLAYQLTDTVSLGAELQPMFGQLRTHFPVETLEFRYKINGPGLQGMAGITARPNAAWAVGLGVRTPGTIWMRGSMVVPGAGRQGVRSDLQTPAQVFLGTSWRGVPALVLSASVRFTDSSSLGDSRIEYELTRQANSAFVPDAHDEWKFAAAAEYAVREQTLLRLGASWATHIVGSRGVNPLVFDDDDTKLDIGLGQVFGHWTVDLMAGYSLPVTRHIPLGTALAVPGGYSMEGGILMLGLMYR